MKLHCRYCNNLYPETDFGVTLTLPNKVYRRRKCRHCYRATKKQLIRKYRAWIDDFKQKSQCKKCGIADYRVLDFHHLRNEGKDFNMGDINRGFGLNRLKQEIDKCILLCANCHRILHYEKAVINSGE